MFDADVKDKNSEESLDSNYESQKDRMFGGVIKNKVSRKNTLNNALTFNRTKSILLSPKKASDLQLAFEKGKLKQNFSDDDTSEDESSSSASGSYEDNNANKPF